LNSHRDLPPDGGIKAAGKTGSGTEAGDLAVLFGALRSGTTMLRLMIDGHPRLHCPGETDFLTDFLVRTPEGGWQYDLDALAADRIFQDSPARLPGTAEAGTAFRSMIADLRGDRPGRLVLVLHRGLDRLLGLAPDIPILHLVRDPRDVARSAIGMGWAGHVYFGTAVWLRAETEWERVLPDLGKDQSLELRFEELVRDPEAELGRLCDFLGERYAPDMLSYPDSSTYARPDPTLTEQWRKKLSARELSLAEPRLGDLLMRRGYAPSGVPPRVPGRVERFALWVRNKGSIWRFRPARFGLRDPLIATLAQRGWIAKDRAAPAYQRMQNVTRRHLK